MPLPIPSLDRLKYDELVAEARSSLPALAPGWTDYNAHDPGITLIELMAWLAEASSYRLDTIPDASVRSFLRLLGVTPRPAQVAQTQLVFASNVTARYLPSNNIVQSLHGDVVFQTTAALYVSTARLQSVLSGSETNFNNLTALNKPDQETWLPLGETPKVDDALYLAFDTAFASTATRVSLGVWSGHEADDLVTRAQLMAEQYAQSDAAAYLCPNAPLSQIDWLQHYAVRTQWEYFASNNQWQPLHDVVDDTRALTLTGTVSFRAPTDQLAGGVSLTGHASHYFIRCRLVRGQYDCAPHVALIALNVVAARHAVDVPPQIFRSNGRASQQYELNFKPLVLDSNSLKLSIILNGMQQGEWKLDANWDGSSAHARRAVLDAESGTLRFGDGRNARVPPAAAEIKIQYQTGGGIAGNVVAGTLMQLASNSDVTVTQPFSAVGGAAAETLSAAKARAVYELSTPTRAVTLADFEWLALATPGVSLARAHAIADYHPAMSCIPVSGSTTVVIIPFCPSHQPTPTPALIATVKSYLEQRRLITSEVHVIAPHYTTVSISAKLQVSTEINRAVIIQQARAMLEQYFDPLTGGANGSGYVMGRAIYRSELLAMLNALHGVLYVQDLSWQVDNADTSYCGNIKLCPQGLVKSGIHHITINEGSGCHE